MKYYTDDELVELVRNISGDSEVSCNWVADKIAERFKQKNNNIDGVRERIDVAARYMGHTLINELIEDGY